MIKRFIQTHLPFISIIIVASVIALWPLFRPGFFVSDDGDWMIIRLSAFYQSWREGQFPVRFLGRLNFGYGYPVANFLYPGYLYLGSVIHAAGVSFVDTIKVIFGAATLIGTLSIFFWLKRKFSSIVSLFGALNFLISPYLLYDIYKRGSVGEVLTTGIAAVVMYSLEARKQVWFTLALAFMIISHNSLALLFLIFFGGTILVRRQYSYLRSIILALGMTAFFWFPALYERQYVIFDSVSVSNPLGYFATGSLWYLIGISSVFGCLVVLTEQKKLADENLWYVFVFLISVSLALPLSTFIWQRDIFATLFQFPYRVLSLGAIAGSFLVADSLSRVFGPKRLVLMGVYCIIWIGTIITVTTPVSPTRQPEEFYSTNEATTTVANEYMPRWVRDLPKAHAPSKMEFIKGRGTFTDVTVSSERIHATINALEDSLIQINTIYYPGWGAILDNSRAEILYDNLSGVIQIRVPHGIHELTLGFRETVPRFIATGVSVTIIVGYLVWSVIPKRFFVMFLGWFQQLKSETVNVIPSRKIRQFRQTKKNVAKRKK